MMRMRCTCVAHFISQMWLFIVFLANNAQFCSSSPALTESLRLGLLRDVSKTPFPSDLNSVNQLSAGQSDGQARNQTSGRSCIFNDGINILEGDLLRPENVSAWNESFFWPSFQIPLFIDENATFDRNERSRIRAAMLEFHHSTCIRFKYRTTEPDFVNVTSHPEKRCASFVGKQGGEQRLYLGAQGCAQIIGNILHQLMHALGFLHEHNRPDRDDHVTVIRSNHSASNSSRCQQDFFSKHNSTYGIAYDYDSILHGSSTFPSQDADSYGVRIIPKNFSGSQIGQLVQLSEGDIEKVNRIYNCSGSGGTIKVTREWNEIGASVDNIVPVGVKTGPCAVGFLPDAGFKVGKQLFILKGHQVWEFAESSRNTFRLKSSVPQTLQFLFHKQLPKSIDAVFELDNEIYFFKDNHVFVLAGKMDQVVLDIARLDRVFPGVKPPVRGIFRTGNILHFFNGSTETAFDLRSGKTWTGHADPENSDVLHSGWPKIHTSIFDLGQGRLMVFDGPRVYVTMEVSVSISLAYGFPKIFEGAFCT